MTWATCSSLSLKLPGDGLANCYAIPGDRRAPVPAVGPKFTQIHTTARPEFRRLGAQNLGATIHGYPPGLIPKGTDGFSRKSRAGKIGVAQLRDDAALFDLHAQYVARGLIDDSEPGEQYVFEAAENALRFGRTPGALFYKRITDYRQAKLFPVTHEIEGAALKRWNQAKHGARAAAALSPQEKMQRDAQL